MGLMTDSLFDMDNLYFIHSKGMKEIYGKRRKKIEKKSFSCSEETVEENWIHI
jgi:hypothetical protein